MQQAQPSNRRESVAANRRRSSSAAASNATPAFPWSKKQLQLSTPFFPRKYLAATPAFSESQNGPVYLFGGASDTSLHNDLIALDPISLTQYLVPNGANSSATPSPRRGHSMAYMQGHLYVFGGTDHTGQASDDALYVYDIANNMWMRPNLFSHSPQCRHMHSVSVVGTKMYIFGGMTHGYYLNDVVVFDSANLQLQPSWQFVEPANEVPPGRTGHSSVVYQEKLYIFGGTDGLKVFDDLWCYDTRNNTWQCIKGSGYVPPSRYGHATCIVQDVMYVFGGRNGGGQGLNDLFAYRFAANRWFTFQKMGPAPSARAGACLVPCGSKVFVFGGSHSDDPPSVVSCLDTSKIRYPPDPVPVRSNPQVNESVRTGPRTSSVPSLAGNLNMKRLTSLMPGRNGFGPPPSNKPVPPGVSQRRESIIESPRQVQEVLQAVPQSSGSQRPLPPAPSSGNAQPDPTPTLTNLPERRQSIQNLSLLQSRAPPQRKESRIIEESVPNEELEAKNEELKALKNKLNWLSAEFYSARKGSEEKDMNSLMDNAGRAGQDGEKAAIYAVMLKLRKELSDTKAMIAQTSSEQAKRLAESEQIRTAALCEAAYQKSRADALAEENQGAFESVDMERTRTLERRLVDVLNEHEKQTVELQSLRAQAQKHSEVARHADAARRGVEERAERALKGRTELEERLRVAEAKVSDLSSGGVDVRETLKKNEHLERSLAEQGSALALAAQILEAANKRADDAESKSESVQTSNFQLQKECGVMRTKMAELESENRSLKTYAVESKSMLIKLKERAESESTLLNTIKSWKSNETLSRSPSVESDTVQRKLAVQDGKHESNLLTEKQLREAAEKRNRDLEAMYERARDDALSMRDECRLRAEEITVARMESESIASRLKATVAALQVVTMKTENGIDVKDIVVGDIEMSEPLREKVAALERKSAKAVEESREMEALHAEAQEEICLMTERNQELESKIQSLVSQNSSNSPDALTARAEEAERQLAATKTSLQAKASKLEKDTYQAIQMVKASESKLLSMQAQLVEAQSAAKESEKRRMLAEAEAEQEREKYEKASRRLAETTTVAMNAQPGDSTLVKEREAWESTKQVLEKRITMLAEMSATGSQDDVSVKELEAMNRALEARHEELKSELAIAIEGRAALERKVEELLEIQRNGDSCREELEATLEKVQSLDQELAKVKSSERAHYQRGMQSEKAASQLASRMAALSQEIAEANDRIEELTAENQTLLAEIKEMDRGRSSDSQSQAQEIIRANQRFEQLARDHQELLAVLGEMETKLEEAKSESQSQESNEEVEKLLAELEQMETRLEESDRNLADSQAQATEEIAQGKEKIEELTREREKLLSQLEEMGTKDSESHAQEIARADEQVEEMNQVHETLLAELEGMEIKLEAAEKSHADSQTRASEEIAECKSRFEELSREHQDLLGQLEEMETKLGEADQSLADSQTKAAEDIAQANARIEELTQERETLVADISAADQDSENRANEELAECKTRIEELTCEQEELVNQLDEMQAKLEEADQSLVESQAKAAEEIAEANAQIEELNVEREKLVADINAMEADMESKDRGLTDAESQANELMTTQAELATATEKLWEADQRYEESTRVIRETEEELESLRREHGDLSEAAEGLKQRVAELLEEQEVSTREHAEKQESLQQEHRDALQVIEGLEQQVAEFSEQRESSTQLIQETEAKLELLREEHREALEEAAALRQQVDDLTKEREISTQQIKEAEEKLESLREEHRGESEGVVELAQKVADLMEEREISTRVIQEAEEKLQTLLEEHRVVLEGSAELKQQIAGLLEVKSVTTQLIQDNEEQLESLRKEYIEAMEGANALKLQIAEISEDQAQKTVQLQSTISDLETQLAESKEATDDLEDELQRTSEVLQKNIEALAQQDETIETLNKKLKETELERNQAVEKVSVLDSRANEAATSRIEIQEKVAALHERLAKVRAKTAVELNEKDEVEE